jgi:hypothetical protein
MLQLEYGFDTYDYAMSTHFHYLFYMKLATSSATMLALCCHNRSITFPLFCDYSLTINM